MTFDISRKLCRLKMIIVYDIFSNLISEYDPNGNNIRDWVYLGNHRLAMIQLFKPAGPGFPGCQGMPDVSGLCGLAGLGDGVALNWVLIAVAPFMVWAVFRFKKRKSVSICVLICGSTIILFMLSRSANPSPLATGYETVYYYHNDHLGTPKVITDLNADIAWEALYEPFGSIFRTTTERVSNPFRFPGQYEDDLTGLYYNHHRYYMPELGRYNKFDPANEIIILYYSFSLMSSNNSNCRLSFFFNSILSNYKSNPYIYSNNRPAIIIDPNGMTCYSGGIGGATGIIGGSALSWGVTCCDAECDEVNCCRQYQSCWCIGAGVTAGSFFNISEGEGIPQEGYSCFLIANISAFTVAWGKGFIGGGLGPSTGVAYFRCCCETKNIQCWKW